MFYYFFNRKGDRIDSTYDGQGTEDKMIRLPIYHYIYLPQEGRFHPYTLKTDNHNPYSESRRNYIGHVNESIPIEKHLYSPMVFHSVSSACHWIREHNNSIAPYYSYDRHLLEIAPEDHIQSNGFIVGINPISFPWYGNGVDYPFSYHDDGLVLRLLKKDGTPVKPVSRIVSHGEYDIICRSPDEVLICLTDFNSPFFTKLYEDALSVG